MKQVLVPGIYQHYKGGLYTALHLVTHHDTRKPMVVYYSHEKKSINCRPLDSMANDPDGWNNFITADGERTLRFRWIREATAAEFKEARDARDAFQQSSDSE